MQESYPQVDHPRWGLTVSFWIVLGGAVLYLVASFLPFIGQYSAGLQGRPFFSNLWQVIISYSGKIKDPLAFAGLLSLGVIFLLLIVQLFARRTMKTLMVVTMILSLVSIPALVRLVHYYYFRLWPSMRLEIDFGIGFYLIILAIIVIFAGSIVGLKERRRS